MITGPVSLVITNQVNGHFAFIAFTIICCCFLTMALVFTPKIVELVRRRGAQMAFGGSHMNGTFHETLSPQEQQEKFQRLAQENDELNVSGPLCFPDLAPHAVAPCLTFELYLRLLVRQSKITEKEGQIDEVRKQIEDLTRRRRQQRIDWATKGAKKAVRICEPPSSDQAPDLEVQPEPPSSVEPDLPSEAVAVHDPNNNHGKPAEAAPAVDELQAIEEEDDFVRVAESTTTDSGYLSGKHSAKPSDFELSESYL